MWPDQNRVRGHTDWYTISSPSATLRQTAVWRSPSRMRKKTRPKVDIRALSILPGDVSESGHPTLAERKSTQSVRHGGGLRRILAVQAVQSAVRSVSLAKGGRDVQQWK